MQCERCGAGNAANRRFCGACGGPLGSACHGCGFGNDPGVAFCGGCGAALATGAAQPALAERRQVAVLFVDLVGFTALTAELGAEGTSALLGVFFAGADAIVERCGGTVDKHIGDCVMALFGAPTAHGDDVARAVRAALAVVAAMPDLSDRVGRDLKVHVGIAVGEVVAGGVGERHRAYTVTGDTVNLAARLVGRAAPGEILVADGVRLVLGDQVRLEALGDLTLQGFARPQPAHRVLGLAEASGAEAGPLVGRRAELDQLTGLLAKLRNTGDGSLVLLRADAGVGKTRLVRELERLAPGYGIAVHAALVLDFGAGEGRDVLAVLARGLLADDPTVAEAALLDPFLLSLLGQPLAAEARLLVGATPVEERRRRLRDAFLTLARAAAARRPLLLVVEDVHWADTETLGAIAAVGEGLLGVAPALLLLTTRREGDPIDAAWLTSARSPAATVVDLSPLQEADAQELAGQLLIGCQDEAVARCVARAQGNPLFLEQLARHLRERLDDAVPISVQTLIQARLDRLELADREGLRAAAVLGQRFTLAALRATMDQPDYDPGPLGQRVFVRPVPEGYLFAHALIRDTVYDLLLRSRRRDLHLRAAAFFASRDALLHAQHLDLAGDPAAAPAYAAAARQQADNYRNEAAVELASRGLELAGKPTERIALACLVGRLQLDLGRAAPAREAFAAALDLADDDVDRCLARLGLAEAMRLLDRLAEALAHLAAAEAAASGEGSPAELAAIHHLRGNILFPLGRVAECVAEHTAALAHARRTGLPDLEAKALGGLGDAEYMRGRMVSARRAFVQCCDLARRHGFGRIEAANLPMVAWGSLFQIDLPRVAAEADAAVAFANRVGHHRAAMIAQHAAWLAALVGGELAEAAARGAAADALTAGIGARRFEAQSLLWKAEALMLRGERPQAAEHAKAAMAISRETAIGFFGPCILGMIAWTATEPRARAAAIEEAELLLARGCVGHNHFIFRRYAIEAAVAAGQWDEVERHAAALADYTAAEPVPWSRFFCERAHALAHHGRNPKARSAHAALAAVRDDASRRGLASALPALDAALAQAV